MASRPKQAWLPPGRFTMLLFVGLITVLSFGCTQNLNGGSDMVLGPKTWQQWKAEAGWGTYTAEAYQPPQEKVAEISRLAQQKNASFLLFCGSWCPDTEEQLPMVIKLLESASVPPERVKLYGVDRQKREASGTAAKFSITKVPTAVVLSESKELGRIVEFPTVSWEDDMIAILSR